MRGFGAKNGFVFLFLLLSLFVGLLLYFFLAKFVVHSLSVVSKNILRVLLTMTSHHIGNWCMI